MTVPARSPSSSPVRCAIYTRKSSDEGLDQQFNSLEAQRSSAEAYIASQVGQGWTCVPDRFDDGGYSGGNMERPALKRLLAGIEAGMIDRVVVYKIDRLTRSIRDFGRIVEVFERHGTAFTSVTQAIDTGTSMGRLMLHVLLSFAAFERELASERTRDKIALSRQRGIWTGGRPILGYDIVAGRLVLNEAEAPVVRRIYALYLQSRSLRVVLEELQRLGIVNKRWTTKDGRAMGGERFAKGRLWQLLTSVLYVGKVPHREKVYDGEHPAIVEESVFMRVQEVLAENGRAGPSQERNRHGGVLKGLLKCAACGCAMTHTTTRKPRSTIVHRYYCCHQRQAMGPKRCANRMVPAEQVEQFVLEKVRGTFAEPALVTLVFDVARARAEEGVRDLEARRALLAADLAQAETRLRKRSDADAAARHEDLAEQICRIDLELAEARAALVTRASVQQGLEQFDPIWACLSPVERNRLLSLVVERVEFDSVAGEIHITLRRDPASSSEGAAA